ncbi:hypothetical protein [Mangrovimonas sp. YM274]|uniref:hypothetical protein n=1 Tax=Mangrovimonas sp. YM274 TaxID=3070660 RepID=UPI0027DE9291|nr:hypothetical protein [Mangrovimonas sp. YM274]WMI68146.1 hypothetical protein RBH95_13450 [Mangrovimonas sp. YM274]
MSIVDMDEHYLFEKLIPELSYYRETDKLEYIADKSSEDYKCYRFTYWTQDKELVSLLVEFDLKRQKVSFGPWGSSTMETHKLDL